jgi:hypothetical protein
LVQSVVVDLPTLAGAPYAFDHLVPAERFGDAAAFDHSNDRSLHRGEPATAFRARPATPNRLPFISFS